jgi:hypothetical protein
MIWTGSLAGLALLTSAALADVTTDRSPIVEASLDGSLMVLMHRERTLLEVVAPPQSPTPARIGVVSALPARKPVPEVRYDEAFLDGLPVAKGDAEWECLARAIYFEARGESLRGQFAVAEVILNRVESPLYPRSICRVVHQGGSRGCQFSFTCDGISDRIREKHAYITAGKIARLMLDGAPRALTDGATHFHTRQVRPRWAKQMPRTASIGQHMFYRVSGGG